MTHVDSREPLGNAGGAKEGRLKSLYSRRAMVGRNVGGSVLRLASVGVTFGYTLVLTRRLGVAPAGDFLWAWLMVVTASQFGKFGMDVFAMRRYSVMHAENERPSYRLYRAVRWSVSRRSVYAILATILLAAGGFAIGLVSRTQLLSISLLSPAVAAYALLFVATETVRGLGRISLALFYQLMFVPSLMCVLLYAITPTLAAVCVLTSLLTVTTAWLADRIVFKGTMADASMETNDAAENEIDLDECRSLWMVSVLTSLGTWPVSLLLGLFDSPGKYAEFHVATRIAQVTTIPLLVVNAVIPPKLAKLHAAGDYQRLGKLLGLTSAGLLATTLLSVPALVFLSTLIFRAAGIEPTQTATTCFGILLFAQFVNTVVGPMGYALSMGEKASVQSRNLLWSSVLGIMVAAIGIPLFGSVAAAVAISVALVVGNLLNTVSVWATLNQNSTTGEPDAG